jgi:hypothetical protein
MNPGSPKSPWQQFYSFGLLPSVAQPPLPLHEFLPLQPLSPVLQPPLPLQEFCPLQEWVSAFLPMRDTPALLVVTAACAGVATIPVIKPAIAAPAIIVFDFMFTFLACFSAGFVAVLTATNRQ